MSNHRGRKALFNDAEKRYIVQCLNAGMTSTQMANTFNCHPRTINRVAEEAGLLPKTSTGSRDTVRLKRLVKDSGISPDTLSQLVMILLSAKLTDPNQLKKILSTGASAVVTPKQHTAALFKPPVQKADASAAAQH